MPQEFRVSGEPVNTEGIRHGWEKIVYALEPLTDTLPEPYRAYFQSPIKLLIGKDISLAYIPSKYMYSYIEEEELILEFIYYADIIDMNYILRRISLFLGRLGLSMSENGLFMKYGPMGYQTVTQRLVSVGMPERRKKRTIRREEPNYPGEEIY